MKDDKKTTTIAVRVNPETAERLSEIAASQDRPVSWVIRDQLNKLTESSIERVTLKPEYKPKTVFVIYNDQNEEVEECGSWGSAVEFVVNEHGGIFVKAAREHGDVKIFNGDDDWSHEFLDFCGENANEILESVGWKIVGDVK